VFSTAFRKKSISPEIQPKLWAYCAGVCRNHDMFVGKIGGTEDHIDLLVEVPPVLAISKALSLIKSNSSSWVKERRRDFAWQKGYGAFSVSASNLVQ
jgi:REP element-mobilizing transposase RayT